MKTKKIPMRTCVVSREKLPKQELIRVVKNKDSEVFIDLTGKSNGKGAYIKKDSAILEKAKKNKILSRVLEVEIPEDIYKQLEDIIGGVNE